MKDIDYILSLLDWQRSEEEQALGLCLAKEVKDISVFLQPQGKSLWENCSRVLYEKSDDELLPYLDKLLEWLLDMNWPGALIVYDRLLIFEKSTALLASLSESIKRAKNLNEVIWLDNLLELKKELKKSIE